jgi:hypothetical protein
MSSVIDERMAAEIDGDFVVFLIGMRVNRPWRIGKWLPTFPAMQRMLAELREAGPASGLLAAQPLGGLAIAQYWRSFEALEAYARDPDRAHWPAWTDFNRRMKACRGDVGIWHETYLVSAGDYEAIYSGMPPRGLGLAGRLVPATGARTSARERLRPGAALPAGTGSRDGGAEAP